MSKKSFHNFVSVCLIFFIILIYFLRSPKVSANAKGVHGIKTIKNPCTRRTSGVQLFSRIKYKSDMS